MSRTRVWTEPCLLEAAKTEYDGVIEDFLSVGEKLFGPYVWGRLVSVGLHSDTSIFFHTYGKHELLVDAYTYTYSINAHDVFHLSVCVTPL